MRSWREAQEPALDALASFPSKPQMPTWRRGLQPLGRGPDRSATVAGRRSVITYTVAGWQTGKGDERGDGGKSKASLCYTELEGRDDCILIVLFKIFLFLNHLCPSLRDTIPHSPFMISKLLLLSLHPRLDIRKTDDIFTALLSSFLRSRFHGDAHCCFSLGQ